ncbi:NTF2-like protein, partial [Zopfia rhizophila CBS 207.26]
NAGITEWRQLSYLAFEWADSYDSKEWHRLEAILAHEVELDYRDHLGWSATMSAKEFLQRGIDSAGDLVESMHHIGASKYKRIADDTVLGYHQVYNEYQRYPSKDDRKTVLASGNDLHEYRKIDGEWKLGGIKPRGRMSHFNFENVYPNGEASEGGKNES